MARFTVSGSGGGGVPGPTGPQGPEGDSAYDVAVANGFVGTEQEWLDSLGGGGTADIADFVFNYSEEDTESTMTIHNHDMRIQTTRDDTEDADIEINSADDIWMTAGDEIEITAVNDEVRIITGAFGQNIWNFRRDGIIGKDGDSGFESLDNGDVKGRLKFEPNNGRALLQAYNNNQTATFTSAWDTATWTAIDSQSQLTLTNASSIISFMEDTGYQVDNLKISVNGSYYAPYNGASSGDGAITFYIQGLMPPEEFTLTQLQFQYAFSSKVDIDFDEGDLTIETKDEMDIVINAADDLFLTASGDDVFIGANNDINFSSNSGSGSEKSWRMDVDGKLQFPAAGYIENIFGNSGDGYGNDTFKIVPDADLETDQYLIIDPTNPNHIHIRPGGEIDKSSAELYVGGERTHVVTDDGSHEVRISTGSTINVNSYLNINTQGNTNFVAESGPVIVEVGYTVEVDGVEYVVDSVTPDSPGAGNITISASGAVFNFNQVYTFRGDNGTNNQWLFAANGTLYGPEENQEIVVTGIVADSQTETLPIFSSGAMTLTANGGDMNFYMDGGMYIGPTDSGNQIIKRSDLDNIATTFGYGSFHDQLQQGPFAANSIQAMQLRSTDLSNDVTITGTNSSQITFGRTGKFNIAFSAQLHQLNGSGIVNIWLNKNGTPVPWTNTRVSITANNPFNVAAWNFFVDAVQNDFYEIMWSSDSDSTAIETFAATGSGPTLHPAVPSVIATVNQVG